MANSIDDTDIFIEGLLFGDSVYTFKGGTLHAGAVTAGHYIAVVLSGKQWYLCDDAGVTPITIQRAQEYFSSAIGAFTPRILFFERSMHSAQSSSIQSLFTEFKNFLTGLYMSVKSI